jgi:hypothetical protein
MRMLPVESIQCPYCGESIDIVIDDSVEHQQYVEDCQVCCRPIDITVRIGSAGAITVRCRAENEV